jgi:Flp pilus assembly protein TadG
MGYFDRMMKMLGGAGVRFAGDRSGAMAVTLGLLMTSFAGLIALSVDVSDWYGTKSAMQSAADAAALGGAYALYNGGTNDQATNAATTDAQLNLGGFGKGAAVNVAIDSGTQTVTATLTKHADVMLSGLFLGTAPLITASAKAGLAAGNSGTPMCLLITSPSAPATLKLSGSSSIQGSGCRIVVNSTSSSAVSLDGSTRINSKSICGPGGAVISGSPVMNPAMSNCAPVSDPLASWPVPSAANPTNPCNYTNFQTYGNNYYKYTQPNGQTYSNNNGAANGQIYYSNGALYLSPGVYCGGISFGAYTNVVFLPGIYVLRNGGLNTAGNTTATGTGVSFYLTGVGTAMQLQNDYIDLSAQTTLTITAPTTGPMAGIAIYQDHTAATGTLTNTLSGNSTVNLTGVLYFGNQNVVVSGSSENQTAGYTSLIAYTIYYSGYSTLYLNSNYASTTVPVPSQLYPSVVALTQ